MEELKFRFCAKAGSCNKSGLSLMILMSNGCTKCDDCEQFFEKKEKMREKILKINSSCTSVNGCHKLRKGKPDSACFDCRNLSISNQSNTENKLDYHARCIDGYCSSGKTEIDINCLECKKCRIFSERKRIWLEFRGGNSGI
jgi:hypothetical protein